MPKQTPAARKPQTREDLWEGIYQTTLIAAQMKPEYAPMFIVRFLRGVIQSNVQLLVDLIEHTAKDPSTNPYKILYGLAHTPHAEQLRGDVPQDAQQRIFAALTVRPHELQTQQTDPLTIEYRYEDSQQTKPPDPANLALRLEQSNQNSSVNQLIYSDRLRPYWQSQLKFLQGYQHILSSSRYYQRYPEAVRPTEIHPFDIFTGYVLDEKAYHISVLVKPISALNESDPLSPVFIELRQLHLEINEIIIKSNAPYESNPLLDWQTLLSIESNYKENRTTKAESLRQLRDYHKKLDQKQQEYTEIAALKHHNFLAINRLTLKNIDTIKYKEPNFEQHMQQGYYAENIRAIVALSDKAKQYYGSLGYALAAECHYQLSIFFSTAYKRSHTEEQKILYKKPWYLNLENAYSHMKYAVALQHRDTELRNAATLGHGFKQAAIAFTNNDDSTWVNRLNHFKSLIQKRKRAIARIDHEFEQTMYTATDPTHNSKTGRETLQPRA